MCLSGSKSLWGSYSMSNTIWTNGCFDILHIGHIRLFEYAKSLGNKLIVGIDSDQRVSLLKGPQRPINSQLNRKIMLEAIKYIDDVCIFNNDQELLEKLKAYSVDCIVVGSDYIDKHVIGSELVQETLFFPRIPDISTSDMINLCYRKNLDNNNLTI